MALYCVVISGRLPGDKDDSTTWAPIAKAFRLDESAFMEGVLPRMPLIVKQGLEQAAATAMVNQLREAGIDATSLADDSTLVLFERDGLVKGPVPLGSLGDFIRVGERYRWRDADDWSVWTGIMNEPDLSALSLDALTSTSAAMPLIGSMPLSLLPSTTSNALLPDTTDEDEPPPLPDVETAPAAASSSEWVPPEPDFVSNSQEAPPSLPGETISSGSWNQPPATDSAMDAPPPLPGAEATPPAVPAPVVQPPQAWSPDPVATSPAGAQRASVADEPPKARTNKPSRKPWKLIISVGGFALVVLGIAAVFIALHQPPAANLASRSSSRSQPISSAQQAPVTSTATAVRKTPTLQAQSEQKATPPVPTPSASQVINQAASETDRCIAEAPVPSTPEERELVASGNRHLAGKAVRGGAAGETYVVEAALGYDGQCRPDPYQIYVFHDQKLVGTVADQAMHPRSDGAITDFSLLNAQRLRVEIAHYGPSAPACCASSTEAREIDLGPLWGLSVNHGAPRPDALSSGSPHPSIPPSFDCQKAQLPTEKAICASDSLSRLDADMGQAYQSALSRLPTKEQALALKDEQRQWIRDRAKQCGSDPACIEQRLRQRITQMQQEASAATAQAQQAQLEQGKLEAGNECFSAANFDCSIQIANSLLDENSNNAQAADLLRRSREAQAKALQGSWNIH